MKNKIIIPTILSLSIGTYLGFLIFNQYKNKSIDVFKEEETVYFLQQGVYSNQESIEENTKLIADYIYSKENQEYRVYVAITTNRDNATKIENIFKEKNYDIYIKEININNKEFVEKLKQYDELISLTEDETVVLGIVKQILEEYELIVNGKQ